MRIFNIKQVKLGKEIAVEFHETLAKDCPPLV